MGLKNNWETLVDDVDYASAGPINQIAEAVIDIEEEMEQQPDIPEIDLSDYVKKEEVFETGSFGWTEFEYTADEEAFAHIEDNSITAASSYPITIHCQGEVIGFTASSNGSYYKLKVNGNNVLENTSQSNVAQTYTLPPTLMTEDIVAELSASGIDFTNMTIQSIKGVSELEEQIGDIDTALDSIIAVQESFMPTATLPGEEEVVSS